MSRLLSKILFFSFLVALIYLVFSCMVRFKVDSQFKISLSSQKRYLVVGNSHPECALNDSLAPMMSNWGRSGEALYYGAIKAKKILKDNPQIKALCIELSVNQLDEHMKEWVEDEKFFVRSFKSYGFLFSYDQFFKMLVKDPALFTRSIFLADKNHLSDLILKKEIDQQNLDWGGFHYHHKSKMDSILQSMPVCQGDLELNPYHENLQAIHDLMEFANGRGIKVILFRCPMYPGYGRCWEKSYTEIRTSQFPNTTFLDFQDWTLQKEAYLDAEHLHGKGAAKFTPYFDSLITQEIQLSL